MENQTNITPSLKQTLFFGGLGLLAVPLIALFILADQLDTGTLRVWAIGATMLIPLSGAGAWYARGALAHAERAGLDTGMTHTLDVVRAVRNPVPPVSNAAAPALLPPPDFELVQHEQRVIDL